jgi:hypothetical protein
VSMFFLVSYGLVNYATYFEATAASPSFRPTFRWYSRYLSLAGLFACFGVALAIDVWSAVISVAVLMAILQYLRVKGIRARWADSRRSFYLKQVRENLLAASREVEHARDWRPYILAFSDSPGRRARLVRFASWVEGGSGITTVVRVLEGHGPQMLERRSDALAALSQELKDIDARAFPMVVAAPSFEAALSVLMQSVGTGPIRVNTVLANWFEGPPDLVNEWANKQFGHRLRTAFRLGSNLLILDASEEEWEALDRLPSRKRTIDVWWHHDRTGQLMVLLAYQMTRNDEWRDAAIRVLVPGEGDDPKASMQAIGELLEAARIDAEPVVVEHASSAKVVEMSAGASIVFLGFDIRGGKILDPFGGEVGAILGRLPPVVMSLAAQDVELDAQPDEGAAAETAALLDGVADARREAARAQQAAAEAAARASKALATLAASAARDEPDTLEKLRADAEDAQEKAQEAARNAVLITSRAESVAHRAAGMGLAVPEKPAPAPKPKD